MRYMDGMLVDRRSNNLTRQNFNRLKSICSPNFKNGFLQFLKRSELLRGSSVPKCSVFFHGSVHLIGSNSKIFCSMFSIKCQENLSGSGASKRFFLTQKEVGGGRDVGE